MTMRLLLAGGSDRALDNVTGAMLVSEATGLPIAQAFADPAGNDYTAASAGNIALLTRACGKLRVIVANSGVVISLDGGDTDHISLPANCMDDLDVPIPAACDIRVKRYTAGVAFTGLVVEVR